ncbi:MAG: PDZ domain-containing protein [Chitinophagales bacterium]|nr:hypothetical protein [Bacteroidota bacterium]
MRHVYLLLIGSFLLFTSATIPNSKVGGIGGQAIFDSIAQRFRIKSLEINHYYNANSIRPGDLILEIDKIPIHKMSYSEVLKLVQGEVGTPMSLKILRYNAIEKNYEINRIRVTLDMNPTWWSIPDYTYYNLNDGIEHAIDQLKLNGKNSIASIKIPYSNSKEYCDYNVKGAYESLYIKNTTNNKVKWHCSFIKCSDKSKAQGMYNYLMLQLRNMQIKNVNLTKTEQFSESNRTFHLKTKETSDVNLINLNMNVTMKQEFDEVEKQNLWKVDLEVSI